MFKFKIELPAWLVVLLLALGLTTKVESDGTITTAGVKWH